MQHPPRPLLAAARRRRVRAGRVAYGLVAYLVFAIAIVYCPGFLGGFPVPKGAADGPSAAAPLALAVDLGLILLFGLHHSVMARDPVKRRLGRWLPEPVERSTYVLGASLLLLVVYVGWLPLPAVVWHLDGASRVAAWSLMAAGWLTAFASSQLIGHGDLFGLRQAGAEDATYQPPALRTDRLHGIVRHPMYLGFLLGVWCLPTATVGHLVFSGGMTAYLLVGMVFEERDLERRYGAAFRAYKASVPALLPLGRRRAAIR